MVLKKVLPFLFVFLFLPILVNADVEQITSPFYVNTTKRATNWVRFNTTELNDTRTSKVFNYSSAGNETAWIEIPKNAEVIKAELNISGLYMFNRTYNCSRSVNDAGSFTTPSPSGEQYRTCTISELDSQAYHLSDDYGQDHGIQMNGSTSPSTALGCGPSFVCYQAGNYLVDELVNVCNDTGSDSCSFGTTYEGVHEVLNCYAFSTTDGSCAGSQSSISCSDAFRDITTEFDMDYWYNYSWILSASSSYSPCESGDTRTILSTILENSSNPWLETGTPDGTYEWSYTGEYNESVSPETADLNATLINDYLDTCSADANGNCDLPIKLHSDRAGKLEIDAINITYKYNSSTLYDIDDNSGNYYWNQTSDIEANKEYKRHLKVTPTANNAPNDISVDGYYLRNQSADYCWINETKYTATGTPKYCPLSFMVNKGGKWPSHNISSRALEIPVAKSESSYSQDLSIASAAGGNGLHLL